MLKTAQRKGNPDPFLLDLLDAISDEPGLERIVEEGMVVLSHSNPEHIFDVIDDWRDESWLWSWDRDGFEHYRSSWGVCDSPEQFKTTDIYDRLVLDEHEWCVFMMHVPKDNGWRWRWHKWGPYIGEGEHHCEYIDEEDGFEDGVYTYHVYRLP